MTTRSPLVLIADADNAVVDLARNALRRQGVRVVSASSGERALRVAEQQRPDLLLLSTGLPGIPGLEVLRRLRARGPVPAILMVDPKGRGRPGGRGFRADDVLTKPFTGEALATRVAEALGRRPLPAASHVTLGGLQIDLDRRTLLRDGDEVTLTRTEWGLLSYLASHRGATLASGEILGEVWGPEYRDDLQFLRVWISRLRSKLGSDVEQPIILTVRGVGYVFDPAPRPAEPRPRQRSHESARAR